MRPGEPLVCGLIGRRLTRNAVLAASPREINKQVMVGGIMAGGELNQNSMPR
jgi:hypothetical protein